MRSFPFWAQSGTVELYHPRVAIPLHGRCSPKPDLRKTTLRAKNDRSALQENSELFSPNCSATRATEASCLFLSCFWQCADKLATTFDANIREPNGFLRPQAFRLTGGHGNPTNGAKDYFWGLVGHHHIWSASLDYYVNSHVRSVSDANLASSLSARKQCSRDSPEVNSHCSLS